MVKRLKLQSLLVSLFLVGSMLTASVAQAISFTGPYEAQNWQISGAGTLSKSPSSGPTSTLAFSYALSGSSVFTMKSWQFSTTAAATGPTTLNWNWSGYHAFFQVIAQLDLFADGPSGRQTISLINAGPVNCCSAPSGGFNYSGSNTIQINQGYAFGFIARGRNFDSDSRLQGTLTLSNFNAPGGDSTPPVITPNVSGTLGLNGWYTSNVSVSWTVTDPESPVTSSTGCGPTTITTDTAGATLTCTATSAGGTASQNVTVKRDATAPTITGSRTPGANGNGWNNTDVTASFVCADSLSGVASCSSPTTLSAEGANQSVTGNVTDQAGNTASATVSGISIDKTAPTITYTGNAGTYTVDQSVAITCAASDSLSGVASDTCATVSGPAYSFAVGANTFSANATDNAGNPGSGSTSFTVQVTYVSLCSVVEQFVSNKGIANSLCVKLRNAGAAAARGNIEAKAGLLEAFKNEVAAQSGKALTANQAAILTSLGDSL